MTEAYCVKCKAKREMLDEKQEKTKNGRSMLCGKCASCKTKMCKFIKADK